MQVCRQIDVLLHAGNHGEGVPGDWEHRGGHLTSRQVSVLPSVSCFTSYLSSLPLGAVTNDPQCESDTVNSWGDG